MSNPNAAEPDTQYPFPGGQGNLLNNPDVQRRLAFNCVAFAPDSLVECPNMEIGSGVQVNGPISIRGIGFCHLGKFASIGYGVTILTSNHDLTRPNLNMTLGPALGFGRKQSMAGRVVVGADAWLGDRVILLPGAEMGPGAVLGAGAVLAKPIPAYAIAVGAPARVIRLRFAPAIIDQLLALAWWDWPIDRMRRNRRFFETDLTRDPGLDLASIVVD